MNYYQGPVYEKSFNFALVIVELYKKLVEQKEYVLSKQLLRSGTSVGANIVEASAAYSKGDFTYRMSVASREARETNFWLLLLKKTSIVKTSQDSLKKNKH